MTNKTRYIPLLLFLLVLFSCTSREERELSALLDRADSLMRTRPDSALAILTPSQPPRGEASSDVPAFGGGVRGGGCFPSVGKEGSGVVAKSLLMRYALLRADALNKCDSVLPSDTLLREVADYYDRHGSANERMRAHYLLGRCYHDMGEAPRALECYQHAAEQADTTREDCDLYTLRAIYGQMADLYDAQYLPDDEMQALKVCERIAWKGRDTLIAIKAYELLLRPYYLKNDTDSILYYVNHSYQLYRKYGYHQAAANIIGMRACIYLDRHQYADAQKDLRIYKNESGLFDEYGNIVRGREIRYYDEGRFQLGIGHVDSALYWFRRVLSYGYDEAAYKGMLDVYKQKNVPDSIAKYAELFAKANDDSYLENSMELMRIQTSLYNYQRNKQIAEELSDSNKRLVVLITATCLLLTIAILLFIVYLQRAKMREGHLQLRIQQLLSEIDRKEFSQKNKKEGNIKETPIYYTIQRKLTGEDETAMKDQEWNELATMLDENCHDFARKLKELYPMNKSEQWVSMLLKAGFSPKQIARLCCLSTSAVSNIRSRLVEKVLHLSASSKAWDQFIQKL